MSQQEVIATEVVSALGVIEHPEKPGVLKLLASKDDLDQEYEIEDRIWQPLSGKMTKLPFFIKIKCSAFSIKEAEAVEE